MHRSPLAMVLAPTLLAVAAAAQEPPLLRVFLLAGQSNMEGHGVADLDDERDYNGGRGNLARFVTDPAHGELVAGLRAEDGSWAVRDDVFVRYVTPRGSTKVGPLSVGFSAYDGRHHFGPELGIGRRLGRAFPEPVLLVKTAWGGKSLQRDFRPPSADGDTGPFYTRMLAEYRAALAALPKELPALAEHRPVLQGVVWFQGWNDACDQAATAEYQANLVHLIADLRAEFGDPALPVVVGETGNHDSEALRAAQRDGCADPRVAAATRFVPTRAFLRAPEDSPNRTHGHHWFGNGESYLRIGDALGAAMVELLGARAAARAAPAKPARDGDR